MANVAFPGQIRTIEGSPREVFAEIAIGATGAPTLSRGKGIASVSRTSAGLYVLTLKEVFNRLLFFAYELKYTAGVSNIYQIYESAADTVASNAGKQVTFTCINAAGAATDPTNGMVLRIKLTLKNSAAD
jgi:hypothetical protein